VDATLLAVAGLNRMNMQDCITKILDWDEMLPAVAQGAIGIQCRSDDETSLKYLAALNHPDTKVCVDCERGFLATLDGNCKTPIAGQAKVIDGKVHFKGLVSMPDGSQMFEVERVGEMSDAEKIGREAGEDIKKRAGEAFFKALYEATPTPANKPPVSA
jgi:hydroxymethylbilane synthase